jgi:hypothetical protein
MAIQSARATCQAWPSNHSARVLRDCSKARDRWRATPMLLARGRMLFCGLVLSVGLSGCQVTTSWSPPSRSRSSQSQPPVQRAAGPAATAARPQAASTPRADPVSPVQPRQRVQSDVPRIPEDTALAILEPWKKKLNLEQVSLGMSREEVVAACSLSIKGPIVQSAIDTIECGKFGDSVAVMFASPPAKPVVIAVSRFIVDHLGNGQFGTPELLVKQLVAAYGAPVTHVTEQLDSTQAEHYAWVFPRGPDDSWCVLVGPAHLGGKELKSGIFGSGPCATHVIARVVPIRGSVSDAKISLINLDAFPGAREEHAQEAIREASEAMAASIAASRARGSSTSGGGLRGGSFASTGEDYVEASRRSHAECLSRCNGNTVTCAYGESQMDCNSRSSVAITTCKIGCP